MLSQNMVKQNMVRKNMPEQNMLEQNMRTEYAETENAYWLGVQGMARVRCWNCEGTPNQFSFE